MNMLSTPERSTPPCDVQILAPKRARYALVIPVWNEGERLLTQLGKIQPWLDHCDIVISDKPSTDGSTAPEVLAKYNVQALVTLTAGGGLSSSLRSAFAYALDAGYSGVIMVDGNDKDDPEALARFAKALDEGWDFVQGSRYCPGGNAINTPQSRQFLIRLVHAPFFSALCRFRFTDTTNGFRAFSRRFLEDPRVAAFRDVFDQYELPYYLAWAAPRKGFKVKEIPVTRAYPAHGPIPTKITLIRGNWRMLKPLIMLVLKRY